VDIFAPSRVVIIKVAAALTGGLFAVSNKTLDSRYYVRA
jgi:hypothetical protein